MTSKGLGSPARLSLPVHSCVRFVLVRPHYPENLGASARAMKVMGFSELAMVRPSRVCVPEHEMAFKMAVKSWDVLNQTQIFEDVESAVAGFDLVVATTARRGVSGVWTPRRLAPTVVSHAARNLRTVVLFGNEKTGLGETETALASESLRIPMAADQPSVNLAQAVQIVAYEFLVAALEQRDHPEKVL